MKKINEWINQKNKHRQKDGSEEHSDVDVNSIIEGAVHSESTAKQTLEEKYQVKQKAIYGGAILLAGIIGYNVFDKISQPDTVAELMPMMEDAREFDSRASDISMAYESIEDDIGEEAFFSATESTYAQSLSDAEYNMQQMRIMDEEVKNRGGITNYEELQAISKTPLDPIEHQRVEKAMETYGLK